MQYNIKYETAETYPNPDRREHSLAEQLRLFRHDIRRYGHPVSGYQLVYELHRGCERAVGEQEHEAQVQVMRALVCELLDELVERAGLDLVATHYNVLLSVLRVKGDTDTGE